MMLEEQLEVSKISKNWPFSLFTCAQYLIFPSAESEHMTCDMEAMNGIVLIGCAEGMQALWAL